MSNRGEFFEPDEQVATEPAEAHVGTATLVDTPAVLVRAERRSDCPQSEIALSARPRRLAS